MKADQERLVPHAPDTSFSESFRIQRRVIGALLLREIITRYGRHNVGFLWLFIEPMLFTLGVLGLWLATGMGHGHSVSVVTFAVTGYSSVLLWRNMPSRCAGAVGPNLALMYHRNVKVIDIYAARLILEWAGASASFIILAITFTIVGLMKLPDDALLVVIGWTLLTWFGMAFGLLIGALSERSEIVEKIWHPVTYLLFPLSGAGFLVDWLPKPAQDAVLLLPMVHGTEIIRKGYFGSSITAHYDVGYMMAVTVGLTLVALALVRETSRRVTPE